MNADMVGVQSGRDDVGRSGRSVLHDAARASGTSSPSLRSRASTRFLSAYLVGGLEGHYYPQLYSPDGVDIDATVKAATANLDIVARHQGACRDRRFRALGHSRHRMAAEIGRRADLPVYVHFGQLWGLPRAAPTAKTPTRSWSA